VGLEGGAADGNLNFTGLNMSNLTLDGGACKLRMIFGAPARNLEGKFKLGASKLTVVLPRGVPVRIRWQGGVSNHNLEAAGFTAQGKTFTMPGFNSGSPYYDFTIDAGVSNLEVEWADTNVMRQT
jgi:hypothetical protein